MGNLKPGDILVFKAGNDWIGKSIAWLTDSDVSHAAVMVGNELMAEMGPSGIHAGKVEAIDGNNAVLLRISPEKDPAPIVSAAQKYIDSKTCYDFPALAFLAGLIIYRRIRPTKKFVAITDMILRAACVALDKLIQEIILKNPDKAMVCSQLVYQVYEDCGKEYHIEIENGLLQAASDRNTCDGTIRLADLANNAPEPDMALPADAVLPNEEELVKELYLALTEQENIEDSDLVTADLGSLPSWVNCFLERLEEFLEKSGNNIPIDALFISPADLAYKSKNLDTVGNVNISRLT